jgi:hypothetical protein
VRFNRSTGGHTDHSDIETGKYTFLFGSGNENHEFGKEFYMYEGIISAVKSF